MSETPIPGDLERFGNPSQDPLSAPFANLAGTATDPTAVILTILKPDTTLLVYGWPTPGAAGVLTRESAGRFFIDIPIDMAGAWRYRLAGSGAVTAASEGSLRVQRSRVV